MQDLRLAFRALRATPIVSAVAILSLALGIGANTAIFSLVNSLLLRMLPVENPQRLMMVSTHQGPLQREFSYAMFDEMRRLNPFASVSAWALGGESNLVSAKESGIVVTQFVSGTYFPMLGVRAVLGRMLGPADDVIGGGPEGVAAVISYGLWQRRFGGDPNIIGAHVQVDRAPVSVVGIVPPDFLGLEVGRGFEITLPIHAQPLVEPATPLTDTMSWLYLTVRLKPEQSLAAGTAALRAAQPAIRAALLPTDGRDTTSFFREPFALVPLTAWSTPLRRRFVRPLVTVFVVVGLVLLIACANIANLMLARGEARRHELSVRTAIGASRWQLARLFLMEAGILACIGTVGALAFSFWASRFIVAQLSTSASPVVLDSSPDGRVFLFTALVMITTLIVSGAAPAVRASCADPIDALKERGPGVQVARLSQGLVVAQVALSLVLVVAAGLFVRTFKRLAEAPLGFDRDRVLVATIMAPTVPAAERNVIYHRLVRAARSVPGVAAAGGSFNPPIVGAMRGDIVVSDPGVIPAPNAEPISQLADVTVGWFSAYGIALRAGRDFDDRDTPGSPAALIVNEAFARRFLPNQNPIGKPIALTFRHPPFGDFLLGTKTIVGVVGDSVYRVIREPLQPTIYLALAQRTDPLLFTDFFIAIRASAGSPLGLTRSVAAGLNAVNSNLALTFRSLAEQVNDSLAQDRVIAMLSAFFGALALLLAALGIYGVTAYAVARRHTEIGIRMALGAAPGGIVSLVLARVTLLIGIGVVVGAGVSLWAAKFVAILVYGLEPRDPVTFIGAGATLVVVGAVAGLLPAYRASRLDPAEVLRES